MADGPSERNEREPSGVPERSPTVDYDPLSEATLADPFPAYAELRDGCPVHHHAAFTPPFFTLSRYDDVREALVDHGTWSIRYGQSPQYTRPAGLVDDPPEHTAFRHLFSRAFTPRVVGRIEAGIAGIAAGIVDRFADRGAGDLHDEYAVELPTIVIARLLGIPEEDRGLFKQMSTALTATYNAPDPRESAAPRAAFDAYFRAILDERRARVAATGAAVPLPDHVGAVLPDDLITSFLVAEVDGRRLDDHELQWMLLLLLLGGNETSTALITNLVWRLLEEPSRWQAVLDDPALIDAAVEESLRHDPPVLGLFRTPTHDVTRHGVTIPAKAKVMVCFAAANRDAAEFERPEEFRLDRPAQELKRHMSFGFGAHFCPGAALARLEARVTLRLFRERLPRLALAGVPERIAAFNLWGRRTLPRDVVSDGPTPGVPWGPGDVAEAHHRIAPYVRRTPTVEVAPTDLGVGGGALVLKLEQLQHSGSFKVRGAFNNLVGHDVPAAGVVAASGGNHGAAVAHAARRLGVPATIFVPTVSSPAKVDRIRGAGADLRIVGDLYADSLAAAEEWAAATGALAVHAFDQPGTILGQATLARELEEQAPQLDTVLVAVGGGGLIAGTALWYDRRVRVVGVEPESAPTLTAALAAGQPVDAPAGGLAADSLAPRRVGRLVFPIARALVDRVVLVDDGAIRTAQHRLWDVLRVVAEPGAATPLAALLSGAYRPEPGERVGLVVSGANTTAVDFGDTSRTG